MRVRVRITGRVQGVGFRYSTCQQAHARGLTGWVRNVADGAVEAEFQGPDDLMQEMLGWCHRGPISAKVVSVVVEPRADDVGETEFRMRS